MNYDDKLHLLLISKKNMYIFRTKTQNTKLSIRNSNGKITQLFFDTMILNIDTY